MVEVAFIPDLDDAAAKARKTDFDPEACFEDLGWEDGAIDDLRREYESIEDQAPEGMGWDGIDWETLDYE